MSPAVPPKALTGVAPSLVELKVLLKAFDPVFGYVSGISGCLFKQKIPTLKMILVLQCFPVSSFPISSSVHTHVDFSFAFCCMENPKVSKKWKADCEKLYNIQGCPLVGNLDESKKSVKNYSLLFCCTADRVWVICQHVHIFFLSNF